MSHNNKFKAQKCTWGFDNMVGSINNKWKTNKLAFVSKPITD